SRGAAGGQSGMLPDGGEPSYSATGGSGSGGSGGGDRVRREIGGERGGPETEPDDRLLRGDGEFFGVLHFEAPARSGSVAGFRPRGARVQFHCATAAGGPGHSGNYLFPHHRRGGRGRPVADLRSALRR